MGIGSTSGGISGGSAAPASTRWVRKWHMDPQNDATAVDIAGGGTYTDDSGLEWSTGGGQVTGVSGSVAVDIVANTSLRFTTDNNTTNIVWARAISDAVSDYTTYDRMLFVVEFTSAPTLPGTNDRAGAFWRNAADNYRHRISNENIGGGNIYCQRRQNGSNSESNRLNNTEEVIAVEWQRSAGTFYYASAFPSSDPLTDDLTPCAISSFSLSPADSHPGADGTDEFGLVVRRNGGSNFTIDIAHMALYRWEAE